MRFEMTRFRVRFGATWIFTSMNRRLPLSRRFSRPSGHADAWRASETLSSKKLLRQ